MIKQSNKHTANVFLPGCLGPVRREVVLDDDHDEEVAALISLNAELLEALEAICAMQARNYGDATQTHLDFPYLTDKARAAIAKARSQS